MRKNLKTISLTAKIAGEMAVEDIPVASWVDTDALKSGDDDPLEVVMAVPAGKSTRGWNYTPQALSSIVGEVNSVGLPGFLGHQKPEDVPNEFPRPVTHWIGAKMQDNVAYFRGLIDKSASDLKRWVRGKAISQVSIYGYPQLETNAVTGETDVTDYRGLSIDWTPLNRAGMPTSVAAMTASGEMDTIMTAGTAPEDDSHEALHQALKTSVRDKLNNQGYIYLDSVYDTHCIAYQENEDGNVRYYKVPYAKSPEDGKLIIGEPREVYRKITWEPADAAGEMGGNKGMNKNLQDLLDAGTITMADIKDAAGGVQPTLETVCGEMFDGKTGNDLINAIKDAAELATQSKAKAHDALIDNAVKAKVSGEMAQTLVRKMLHVGADATEGQINGEIDNILADKSVQAIIAQAHVDTVPPATTAATTDTKVSDYFAPSMTAL